MDTSCWAVSRRLALTPPQPAPNTEHTPPPARTSSPASPARRPLPSVRAHPRGDSDAPKQGLAADVPAIDAGLFPRSSWTRSARACPTRPRCSGSPLRQAGRRAPKASGGGASGGRGRGDCLGNPGTCPTAAAGASSGSCRHTAGCLFTGKSKNLTITSDPDAIRQ